MAVPATRSTAPKNLTDGLDAAVANPWCLLKTPLVIQDCVRIKPDAEPDHRRPDVPVMYGGVHQCWIEQGAADVCPCSMSGRMRDVQGRTRAGSMRWSRTGDGPKTKPNAVQTAGHGSSIGTRPMRRWAPWPTKAWAVDAWIRFVPRFLHSLKSLASLAGKYRHEPARLYSSSRTTTGTARTSWKPLPRNNPRRVRGTNPHLIQSRAKSAW